MSKKDDRLQERLERLAAGEPLEICQAGLPEDEAALLDLASRLGALPFPERDPEIATEQRFEVVKLAAKEQRIKKQASQNQDTFSLHPLFKKLAPATALSGALALLLVCAIVAFMGGRTAWRGIFEAPSPEPSPAIVAEAETTPTTTDSPGPAPVTATMQTNPSPPTSTPTESSPEATSPSPESTTEPNPSHEVYLPMAVSPMSPTSAKLEEVHGVAEIRVDDGTWYAADDGQIVKVGQRIRTGALSGATLRFYDNSTAHLGPDTEVSVDELGQTANGSRIVELTQWSGETDHDVTTAHSEAARYEVHTPTGTGEAKGTRFHVVVTPALVAHFRVDEGAVAVTHLKVTVIVLVGQLAIIEPDHPPTDPTFHITGEGRVTQTGTTWIIGEQDFETHQGTIIVGNPQINDWVLVEGHLEPDGTRIADRIVLLHRSPENRFTITGRVEAIEDSAWTVAGQSIATDEETEIEDGIDVDDMVRVEGVILEDGTLLAHQIQLLELEPGLPFRFVGVVQEIDDDVWIISDLSIAVDNDTLLDDDLAIGDLVEVEGWFLEDSTRLARAIRRLEDPGATFEFSGIVERFDPWTVSGITFETRVWTEIEAGIAIGDAVKVEGRVLKNGTWLASEVKLLEDDEPLRLEFAGRVESIAPWIVAGISLPVDVGTEIKGPIEVGTLVKVEVDILPDGTWLVVEIKVLEAQWDVGCMHLTALIIRIEDGQLVLEDGTILPLDPSIPVYGDLQTDSVILIYFCVDADGEITIYSIVILHEPEPEPIPIPPSEPPPDDEGQQVVTVCHKPGTPAEQTLRIPRSALPDHLAHGDYLGPCK